MLKGFDNMGDDLAIDHFKPMEGNKPTPIDQAKDYPTGNSV